MSSVFSVSFILYLLFELVDDHFVFEWFSLKQLHVSIAAFNIFQL